MGRSAVLLLLVSAWPVLAPSPARADSSMRCDGGIVSVGDSKVDLLGKCGKPALIDERPQKQWYGFPVRRAIVNVEEWTYNFGPNQFLRFVTLLDGKVARFDRGGYGYAPESLRPGEEPGRAHCEPSALRTGDRKLDLLAKCGEPVSRESRLETRGDDRNFAIVEVEVWSYDFGPQSFIEFVTLEDGKVVAVERGGYGYAR